MSVYPYDSESAVFYADLESPLTDEAFATGLAGGGRSFAFHSDIDAIDAFSVHSSSAEVIDWTFLSNPYPSAYSDTPSSVDTAPPPLTPLSHHTLVGSPHPCNDFKIFDEEELDLSFIDAAPSPSTDFAYTFEYHAPAVMSPFPPELPLELVDIGYEQPTPQQHEIVAASASVHGLAARGVEVNAAQFAFTSTTPASPMSPLASASPEPMEKMKIVKRIRTKADPEASSQQASPTKRRRRQDTTPKYPCPVCDASQYPFCFHPNTQCTNGRNIDVSALLG